MDIWGKVSRRLRRAQRRLAATRPQRVLVSEELTGTRYARTHHVSSTNQLNAVMRRARWTASTRNPELILLAPGTYTAKIDRLHSVDIAGATKNPAHVTLTWSGPDDTVNASGIQTTLAWLTIEHTGPHSRYAIHADGPGHGAHLTMTGIHARADDKGALGIGLEGGQTVEAHNSTFTRATRNGSPAAILAHNWKNQTEPCTITFHDCTATAPDMGNGFRFTDLGSGQPDRVTWDGGTIHGATQDVWIETRTALVAINA